MFKKKKKEPIVIDKTELMPTVLGSLETKENGPIVAIVWILLFVLCIFSLPYLTNYITELKNGTSTKNPSNSNKPTSQDPTVNPPAEEVVYFDITDDLIITKEGFQFSNITVNNQTLNFLVTNINGSSSFFQNHDYYIELYDEDLTLLQRIKLTNVTISNSRNFAYNIQDAYTTGVPAKIVVVEKAEQDYPQVTLALNNNDIPILTCQKGANKITYLFENENSYRLQSIETDYIYASSNADYDSVLTSYSTQTASYNTLAGVTAELTPIATGFTFHVEIDLTTIPNFTYKNNFSDAYFYEKNTEAKVIAFELETSGYNCN